MLGLPQLSVAPRLAKSVARTRAVLRQFADILEAEHNEQAIRGDPATNAWELLCDVEALHRKLQVAFAGASNRSLKKSLAFGA